MYLFDVNIFVHMHRIDSPEHDRIFDFALDILQGSDSFGYSPLVLNGFLRVVTHPKIFKEPTDFETAIDFVQSISDHPNSRLIQPGEAHWHIYKHLCYQLKPVGNFYPDVYYAALAIDSGCTWVSCDHNFKRFTGLNLKLL